VLGLRVVILARCRPLDVELGNLHIGAELRARQLAYGLATCHLHHLFIRHAAALDQVLESILLILMVALGASQGLLAPLHVLNRHGTVG